MDTMLAPELNLWSLKPHITQFCCNCVNTLLNSGMK